MPIHQKNQTWVDSGHKGEITLVQLLSHTALLNSPFWGLSLDC